MPLLNFLENVPVKAQIRIVNPSSGSSDKRAFLAFFHYPAKSLQLSLNVYEDVIFNAVCKGGKNTGKPLLLSLKATNMLFGSSHIRQTGIENGLLL